MTTIELNSRKYSLIAEIMRINSEDVIERIENLINSETQYKRSPLSFTVEELKIEIAEAENESVLFNQDEVKTMTWKK
jgi:hypothetical protein